MPLTVLLASIDTPWQLLASGRSASHAAHDRTFMNYLVRHTLSQKTSIRKGSRTRTNARIHVRKGQLSCAIGQSHGLSLLLLVFHPLADVLVLDFEPAIQVFWAPILHAEEYVGGGEVNLVKLNDVGMHVFRITDKFHHID